ncbi:hypothetical protein J3458_002677 [Metarhizium acridum]|nr:hypothetical protein J3458_002677 [Metarhizium acridum]
MSHQASLTNNLDLRYWMRHSVPPLLALLRAAGSYSDADQGKHIQFLCDYVLPNFGPRPTEASPSRSRFTQSGFPMDLSLNLNAGKPKVRYCWEFLGPNGPEDNDMYAIGALRKCLESLATELGFSTQWADALLDALAPTPEEATTTQQNIRQWQASLLPPGVEPKPGARLPFAALAFGLDGPRTDTKFYISPQIKELGSAKSMNETIWNVARHLEPPISQNAIRAVSEFLLERPGPPCMDMLCVDLVKEQNLHRARFKIYVHTTSNSFNTVRQCISLGGRRQDEATLKGLEVLRTIWHLLLQEKEEVTDDNEKPVNDPAELVMKLFFCIEFTPGEDLPDVKLHVPIFNYLKSDRETIENLEKVFLKCGQEWAVNGKYREAFELAL